VTGARPAAVWFDLYGTLVDLGPLVGMCEAAAPGHGEALAARWRQRQVEASWLTTLMDEWRPFDELTARALRIAAAELGIAQPLDVLDGAFERLPAAAAAGDVLRRLRAAGIPIGVLSNGSGPMIERTLLGSRLAGELDRVESVDAVRRYKPDPAVYALATAASGAEPPELGFVTANGWDAAGAATFGFRVVWLRPVELAQLASPAEVTVGTWATVAAAFGVPDA
jgi:2-haloacid dehalogenase